MSKEKDLIKSVSRVVRALWIRNTIEQVLRLGFYGAILSLILILLVKFSSLLYWVSTSFCFIPLISGMLLGLLLGIIRKPRLSEAALFLDRSLALQNRLATLLEHIQPEADPPLAENPVNPDTLCRDSSNPLIRPLLSDTMRYQAQFLPAVAYKRFNANYLFQYLLAGLGIIILWLIPAPPRMFSGQGNIAQEQSEKLKTTAQDISQSDDLDEVTKAFTKEMDGIARAIEDGKISPEEILQRLDALSQKVKEQNRHYEVGQGLFTQISFIMGESPSKDMTNLDPERVKKTLDHLQDQIRQGHITVDLMGLLKQAISQTKDTVQDNLTLKQPLDNAIKALETPAVRTGELRPKGWEANLAPALQEFFDTLASKNRAVLERIRARLSIASKEISRVIKSSGYQTSRPIGSQNNLSRANGSLTPFHPTGSASFNTFDEIPITSTTDAERINLIKEVIKHREAAFNKPYWPPEYDEIIRQYFLPAVGRR